MGLFSYTKEFIVNTAMPARRTPFSSGPQNWTRRLFEGVSDAFTALSSTDSGKGASQVGIEDALGNFTSTDVEGALAELAAGGGGGGGGVTGVTASSPLASSGGATPDISLTGTVSVSLGGTGTSTVPANGQLLIGNGAGYTLSTLTDGANITVTEGAGSITVDAVPSGAANEVQYNSGGTAFGSDPNFTYDGVNLTVFTGGSAIDIGQGFITGNPGLTVETGIGGTLTLGNGDNIDLVVAQELRVNGSAGAVGEVLTSNGPGVPATWQAPTGGIGGTIAATEIAFGTGADTIDGAATFTYDSGNNIIALDQGNGLTGILVRDVPLIISSDLQSGALVLNSSTEGATLSGTGVFLEMRYDTLVGQIPTIRTIDETTAAAPLDLAIGELRLNSAAGSAGQVLTSNGAGAAPTWQAVTGLGPANKIHYVVEGGSYATIQAAIDAAADLDVIYVGPKTGGGSWGSATFSAGKRLVVIGMQAKYEEHAQIDSVTFSPTTGLNILLNTIYIRGLFINSDFSVATGVTFGGTAPARLRMQECYVYNSGASGTGVSSNNSGAGSSLHIDNCIIQSGNSVGVGVNHVQGYTIFKNGCEVSRYQYPLQCAAGNVEILDTILDGSGIANEVIRISGGTVTCGYSTIKNSTANSSGVNLTTAGAVFGMGDATFAIATGTGYCVNGVASTVFLYGSITYSHSALASYNVKVKNTISAVAVTQVFTSSP